MIQKIEFVTPTCVNQMSYNTYYDKDDTVYILIIDEHIDNVYVYFENGSTGLIPKKSFVLCSNNNINYITVCP